MKPIKKTTPVILWGLLLLLSCHNNNPVINDDPDPYQFENAVQFTFNVVDSNPRWSPQGGHIIFERNNYIYLLDILINSVFIMTEGRAPAWSPDGTDIAFVREGEIYTIRAKQGALPQKMTTGAQVSSFNGLDWGGGSRIAYFQTGDSLSDYILTIYSMGSQSYQLINQKKMDFSDNPRWSRDNSSILFGSTRQRICIYDIDEEVSQSLLYWTRAGKPCWYTTTDFTYILYESNEILQESLRGKS